MESAKRLLDPPGFDTMATSSRHYWLRKNTVPRAITGVRSFTHGQSISLCGIESKGSAGVFLSPDGQAEYGTYALTAYHVLLWKTAKETRVMTPGGLDVLSRLLIATRSNPPDDKDINFLVDRWNETCGDVKYSHIGANKKAGGVIGLYFGLTTGGEV